MTTALADLPPVADADAAPERAAVIAFLRRELLAVRPTLAPTWPDDALFRADLALDSLDLVELAARAEQEYRIFIADDELPGLVSLAAMADWLRAHVAP